MAQVIKEIQVEVSKPNFFQAIVAKQYDKGSRYLRATFVDNGEKITIADTSYVRINARRIDGATKATSGTIDKGKGTVKVPLTGWMLELEGRVICDISVTDSSGNVLTTTSFTVEVERASHNTTDTTPDTSDVTILQGLINEVTALKGEVTPSSTYDPTSDRAMSGKAVAQALQNVEIDVDNAMDETSENPVQNKVAKKYVDDADAELKGYVDEVTKKTELIESSKLKEQGANILDEEKDAYINPLGANYMLANVPLDGTEGFVVISTKGNYKAQIKPIKLYDSLEDGNVIFDTSTGDTATNVGATTAPRTGIKITIPSNARRLFFQYQVKSASGSMCSEMMVTIGETLPTEYKPCEYINTLKDSPYLEQKDIDNKMSGTSTNPVQTKVAKAYIDKTANELGDKISIDKINFVDDSTNAVAFKSDNDSLIALVREYEDITLDDIAFDGKTYRDIFITNNLTKWGDFEGGFTGGVSASNGTPEISIEQYQSGSKSMKCFDSSGIVDNIPQAKATINSTIGSEIYYACSVRMDRYVAGQLGMQVSSGTTYHATIQNKNGGFERKSVCVTTKNSTTVTLFVGSMSVNLPDGTKYYPDLDGYVDDVVAIDLSIFSTKPSQSTMDILYDNYIQIIKGQKVMKSEKKYVIADKTMNSVNATDDEYISAFMEKVNEKAQELGMTNSKFFTPSGAGTDNYVTARDLVRLYIGATAYDKLMKVWGKPSKTIYTKNETPVQHDFTSGMYTNMNTSDYYFMGGKTGSWSIGGEKTVNNFGAICKVEDKLVVGVVMDASSTTKRYQAINKLFDVAKDVITTGTTVITELLDKDGNRLCQSACCCILPCYNINMYENYPFEFLFEQDADTQILPASITKVITAMVMLDYIKDLDETLTFIETDDDMGGSGNVFNAGDIITYRDSLYALMLPSSNMTGQAIARCVGRKILEKASP